MKSSKVVYLFVVQFLGYLWYLSLFGVLLPFLLTELSLGLDYYLSEVVLGGGYLPEALLQIPQNLINLLSLVLIAFGVMITIETVIVLYQDAQAFPFTIISHKELTPSNLSKSGWYGVVRHPMILGYLIALLGVAVYVRSVSMIVWWIPLVGLLFLEYALVVEERMLVRWFGNDYKEYQKRVPALIPRLKSFKKLA